MKNKGSIYYEHTPTKSLCIYRSGKKGRKKLFVVAGKISGTTFIVTKERFRAEFRKVEKDEVPKYFEKDKIKTQLVIPEGQKLNKSFQGKLIQVKQ